MQPRGTHGDVISTTELETYYKSRSPPTTKSLVVSMYEWPILLGLSLGKSLSIPITASLPAHSSSSRPSPVDSRPTVSLNFIPALFHLSAYSDARIGGTKISFFTGNQDGGLRNCAAEKHFLRCRFLSLRFLITIHHADAIISSLVSDIWNAKLKSIVNTREKFQCNG